MYLIFVWFYMNIYFSDTAEKAKGYFSERNSLVEAKCFCD